jgi:hypothetical protein
MTLTDHLKNVAEHRKEPVYHGEKFPLFLVNRFFSFVSDPHCRILNQMINYPHWTNVDEETKLKLLQSVLPKVKYNYYSLFSGYVKKPKIERKIKSVDNIERLCKMFEISKKEAEAYLEDENVEELIKNYEK